MLQTLGMIELIELLRGTLVSTVPNVAKIRRDWDTEVKRGFEELEQRIY